MIRFLSYLIKLTKWNRYYYFKNNNFEEITLIILFLNMLLISNRIKNYIFDNNIYVVNDYKIYKSNYSKSNNVVKSKIIRNLTYKDKYYKIDLQKIKNKMYVINDNISIDFLLKYFYNINRHNDSCIIINYFRTTTKILKINFNSCFIDLY